MDQVRTKSGGRWWPVRQARGKIVVVTKREKREEQNKLLKNQKDPLTKKNVFFGFCDKTGLDLLASP
jgi:hypothetical protein